MNDQSVKHLQNSSDAKAKELLIQPEILEPILIELVDEAKNLS